LASSAAAFSNTVNCLDLIERTRAINPRDDRRRPAEASVLGPLAADRAGDGLVLDGNRTIVERVCITGPVGKDERTTIGVGVIG
jgi:hypothetical protein